MIKNGFSGTSDKKLFNLMLNEGYKDRECEVLGESSRGDDCTVSYFPGVVGTYILSYNTRIGTVGLEYKYER